MSDDQTFSYDLAPDPDVLAGYKASGNPLPLQQHVAGLADAALAADGREMADGVVVIELLHDCDGDGQRLVRVTGHYRTATTAEAAHLMLQATADEGWTPTEGPGDLTAGDTVRVLYAPPAGHARIVVQGTFHAAYGTARPGGVGLVIEPITLGEHLDDKAIADAMAWHEHVAWHVSEGHSPERSCKPMWELQPGSAVQVKR